MFDRSLQIPFVSLHFFVISLIKADHPLRAALRESIHIHQNLITMKLLKLGFFFSLLILIAGFSPTFAQGTVTLPQGPSQLSSVTQHMGLVSVNVEYSSPGVNGREGQIWGQLVPHGMNNLGFGTATESPWRAGANQNTVITFSHDVKIGDKDLEAGTYGLHVITAESGDWTWIFSKNTSSWGSYYYEESEDALRVKASPKDNEFTEWLTYEFTDRGTASATLELQWEKKSLPMKIEVPNMTELYLANMRDELRSTAGFSWQGFNSAATYCLNNNTNLEEALGWIEQGISAPFIGQANFQTLQTKSLLLFALNKDEEAKKTMMAALDHDAQPMVKYQFGSALIQQNKNQEAYEFFKTIYDQDPDAWISHAGMGAGLRVTGQKDKAMKHYKKALEGAPAQWKAALEARIKSMQEEAGSK